MSKCEELILEQFKGALPDRDIKKIFDSVAQKKKLNPNITEQELFKQMIEDRRKFLFKKIRILNQVDIGNKNAKYVAEAFKIDGINEANAKNIIEGFISRNGKYQRTNLEAIFLSTMNEYLNAFSALERKQFMQLLRSRDASPEFFKEVAQGVWAKAHGIEMKYKFPEAAQAIDIIHGINKKRLLDLQSAGYDIKGLQGYVFSGSYDPSLLRKVGFETFLADAEKGIDVEKQMLKWGVDRDGFKEVMKEIYNNLSTRDSGEITGIDNLDAAVKELKNPDRVNNIVSSHRVFEFRDGESFYEFFNKYSGDNLMEAVFRDLKRTARTVSETQVFGTAPELGIDQIFSAVNKHLMAEGLEPLGKKYKDNVRTMRDMALGKGMFADNMVARIANATKQIANMALLGKAAFKALFTDPVMAANVSSVLSNENYYYSMMKYLKTYIGNLSGSIDTKEFGRRFNIIAQNGLMDLVQERAGISGFERGLNKLHSGYMKITGLNFQSFKARTAMAQIAMHHLSDIFNGKVAKELGDADLKRLKMYGFDDDDIKLMRLADSDVGGTKLVDPGALRDADPAAIREALGAPKRKYTTFGYDKNVAKLEEDLIKAEMELSSVLPAGVLKKADSKLGKEIQVLLQQRKILEKSRLEDTLYKQYKQYDIELERLSKRKKTDMVSISGEKGKQYTVDNAIIKLKSMKKQIKEQLNLSATQKEIDSLEVQIAAKRKERSTLGLAEFKDSPTVSAKRKAVEEAKAAYEKLKSDTGAADEGGLYAHVVEKDLTDEELVGKARQVSQKLGAYANDYAMLGSPNPTAVVRWHMAGMQDPNTPSGALISLLLQFKAFGASVYRVHRNAAWHSGVAETNKFKQYLYGGRGALVHTMLTGTVIGAGVNMLNDIVDGKTPRDPTADPLNFLNEAITTSGTGGLYMDYVLSDYEQGKKDIAKDMLGPVAGRMLPDAAQIYGEMWKAVEGKDNKLMETSLNKMLRWAPGQNLFFGKAALDMLFLDKMRAWADPRFEGKRKKFMKESSGDLWRQKPLYED